MHPLVRDLYRRFLVVGKDYPLGLAFVREKAKAGILANAQLTDEVAIRRAVARGRYMVRELVGVIQLKKYRQMKQRYGIGSDAQDPVEDGENQDGVARR